MIDNPPYLAAFMLGLMGSTHCIGMCGGISSSLGLSYTENRSKSLLYATLFNLGRINSYLFAGLLLATIGSLLPDNMPDNQWVKISRTIAAVLLILMALYIGQWWLFVAKLENLARPLWQLIQPLTNTLLPVNSPGQALGLGFIWGWIPCGLVYSTLAWASLSADGIGIAWLMLLFGLGTAPVMIASVFFANRLKGFLQQKGFRRSVAAGLLFFALWTLYSIYAHPSQHHQHNSEDSGFHQAHPALPDQQPESTEPATDPANNVNAQQHHHH